MMEICSTPPVGESDIYTLRRLWIKLSIVRVCLALIVLFDNIMCCFLDDDYLEKNIPTEAEELSFEISYSEMVTEAPKTNNLKKLELKKEDCVLTVSKSLCDYSSHFQWLLQCTRALDRSGIRVGMATYGGLCCTVHSLPGCAWQPRVQEGLRGYRLECQFTDRIGFLSGLYEMQEITYIQSSLISRCRS